MSFTVRLVAGRDRTGMTQDERSRRGHAPLAEKVAAELARLTTDLPGGAPLGVAVSGGGDSMALLHLAAPWARREGRPLVVFTVDHGLRPREEIGREIALVRRAAERLGLPHRVLPWRGWTGRGNLQAAARAARYRLLAEAAREEGAAAVLLGHTQDDQAETVLMRLGRGAGARGLSAMMPRSAREGMIWLRPLLGTGREALRAWLEAREIVWAEDPSNAETAFERIRTRQALDRLREAGIDPAAFALTARRLARADAALEATTDALVRTALRVRPAGSVALDPAAFLAAPEEVALRLLMRVLARLGRLPRHREAEAALERLRQGERLTLGQCLVRPGEDGIRIIREWRHAEGAMLPPGPWDRRWEIRPSPGAVMPPPAERPRVAALGPAGLAELRRRLAGEARPFRLPAAVTGAELEASPALRAADGRLVAVPLAGWALPEGRIWRAELRITADDFVRSNLSH